MLRIDKGSRVPLYRQLKEQIREAVDTGTWAAGEKLPSEREMFTSLDVSRITVRQALSELVAEGYLVSAAGKGFFVAERAQELDALVSHTTAMRGNDVEPSSRVLTCTVETASPALARGMGLDPGAEVVRLHRVRLGDGVPLTVQQVWLPHRLVPGLAEVDFTTASLFEQLRNTYELHVARAETVVSARLADPEEASALELPPPAVGLTVDQITFDIHDRILEMSRSLHHPTRLPIRVTQAVGPAPGSAPTQRAQAHPAHL